AQPVSPAAGQTDPTALASADGSGALPPPPPPPPGPTSPDGTVVIGTIGDIVTAAGNSFAIDAAGQITENGNVMGETSGVSELAYVGGTLYQEATSQNLWWSLSETNNQWTQTTEPVISSGGGTGGSESADGTVITGTTGDIVSALGNV